MKNERKIKDFIKKLGKLCEDENIFIEAGEVDFVSPVRTEKYNDLKVLNFGHKINLYVLEDEDKDDHCFVLEADVAKITPYKSLF